ncbi:MAG TPA: MobF family relaxase [Enteractinococcus sp.]
MKGGWTAYRSPGAAAIKKYFYGVESSFDHYYFKDIPEGSAERLVYQHGSGVRTVSMDADAYETWVDFADPDTGESRGTVRKNAVRFLEKNINVDKTLSLAALDSDEVALQLRAAMREAVKNVTEYAGQHFTTRRTVDGRTMRVPIDQLEAAVIAHKTSRENEPHPHLHLQFSARVKTGEVWRGLDTADAWKHNAVINALVEHTIHTHPGLRKALADHGLNFDPGTGKVAELEPYVEAFSTRHAQIEYNKALLEENWRANPANAGKIPGPALRSSWDYIAWNGTAELEFIDAQLIPRPAKEVQDPASLESLWRVQLAEAGYQSPQTPTQLRVAGWPPMHELAEHTLAGLAAGKSSWSNADIRAEALKRVTGLDLVSTPSEISQRLDDLVTMVQDRCRSMADPRVIPDDTVAHWTTQSIIDTDDELKTRLAARASAPAPALDTEAIAQVAPHLNAAQTEAAAALASGTNLTVVEGYAGAGKTALLEAASQVRGDRPLLTVTPTLKAAQEARSAGSEACSLHKLLHAHGYRWNQDNQWHQLAPGDTDPATGTAFYPPRPDSPYHLTGETQLVVDEAGMLDQEAARALLELADRYDADVAMIGDRAQLSAVGRGGVMDMAARVATHTVTLDEVHRFADDTDYAELSKLMRNRDRLDEVFDRLHHRGNLRIHHSADDARAAVADDVRADIEAGRTLAVTVATNAQAAALNADIQAQRITAGHLSVHEHPATGRDGLAIYVGDIVMTRSNNPELGVANRESFRVVDVHSDGGLILAGEDQRHHHIDANYVRDHIHLGYAVTDYGNQGTTVDHGSVLLESSMSGGGVYVGATRGRHDNTIHIVADDTEDAKAQFITALTRDRADRGLDQAREELAQQLPRHTMAVHPRIRRYIDNMSRLMARTEATMEKLQPLADHHAKVQAFKDQHQTTPTQAHDEARAAQQAAAEKAAALEAARDQIHRQTLSQVRSEIQEDLAKLQAAEQRVREAGFFTRSKAKHNARTMRQQLEDRYGIPLPGTDKTRFNQPHRGQDTEWAHTAAQHHIQGHPPDDGSLDQIHQEVEHLHHQAHQASQRAETLQQAWNTQIGPAPDVEGGGTYQEYLKAQQRHAQAQDMIEQASNPEHHAKLLGYLQEQDRKKTQRQAQRPPRSKTPDTSMSAYLQRQRIQQSPPGRDGLER